MEEIVKQAAEAMRARGFRVECVQGRAEAKARLLALIPQGASVGVGGSMTIRELNVIPDLEERGAKVWWHWTDPGDRAQVLENARKADVYLASTNAVTKDGQLVNIDGNGNRVGSMAQGPQQIFLVIGQQKIVDGGLNSAIARIRQQACPPNAKRLNRDTPCARTGVCNQAECGDDCMCRVIMMLQRPPKGREITVILTEEAIGY